MTPCFSHKLKKLKKNWHLFVIIHFILTWKLHVFTVSLFSQFIVTYIQYHLRHYYENTDAVIFVVDSTDRGRLCDEKNGKESVENELNQLLCVDQLRDAIFLIFANKQDMRNTLSAPEISEMLNLRSPRHKWRIQPCSAVTGDGLYEGLNWLSSELK